MLKFLKNKSLVICEHCLKELEMKNPEDFKIADYSVIHCAEIDLQCDLCGYSYEFAEDFDYE